MARTKSGFWILGLILLLGVLVEIPLLKFLLPDFAIDDEMVALQGFYGLAQGDFSGFAFYKYPGLFYLVLFLFLYPAFLACNVRALVHLESLADLKYFLLHPWLPDAAAIYLGRVESLVAGLVSVWLLFAIFRRRIGGRPALLSCLFMLTSCSWLFSSSVLKNDNYLLVCLLVLVHASFNILEKGRSRDYLLAGLAFGLCLAAKYHVFALAPILFAHWLRRYDLKSSRLVLNKDLASAMGLALAVFFVFSPVQFLHPVRTFHALTMEMAIQSQALPLLKARPGLWYQAPVLFQLLCALPCAMGVIGYLTALAGAARLKKYLELKPLVLFLSYPVLFFLGWAVISRLGYPHLYLPLIPFLAVLAGIAIDGLFARKSVFRPAGAAIVIASALFNILSFADLNRGQSKVVFQSLEFAAQKGSANPVTALFPYRPLKGSKYQNDFIFLPQFVLSPAWIESEAPARLLVHQTWYLAYLDHPEMDAPAKSGFEALRNGESGYRLEKEWSADLTWAWFYTLLFPDWKNLSAGFYAASSSAAP